MKPPYWDEAVRELGRRDRTLARIMGRHPEVSLRRRSDAFTTLARAIVGQQISVRAAAAIWQRITELGPVEPQVWVDLPAERLRACGLSPQKLSYVVDLAQRFHSGAVKPRRWARMEDEAIIEELVQVRGIGRWTAEMFLIFNLLRPDVLPVDDQGLRRAMALQYNGGDSISPARMRDIALNWAPWRSVATWYLWRSLDDE